MFRTCLKQPPTACFFSQVIAIPAELTQVVESSEEKIRELRLEASKLDEAEAEVKKKQDEVKRRVEAHFNRVAEEGKRLEQLKKVMGILERIRC